LRKGQKGIGLEKRTHPNREGRISTLTWRKAFGREVWKRNNFSEASLIKLSLLFNHSSTAVTRIYLDITLKRSATSKESMTSLFIDTVGQSLMQRTEKPLRMLKLFRRTLPLPGKRRRDQA